MSGLNFARRHPLWPLTKLDRWLVYSLERKSNGAWNKPPRQVDNGYLANYNNPQHWATYSDALAVVDEFDGLGFAFLDSGIGCVDLDHVLDEVPVKDWRWIVDEANSWTEVSPSGSGLHILGYAKGSRLNSAKYEFGEVYRDGGYVTVTGKSFGRPRHLRNIDRIIDQLHDSKKTGVKRAKIRRIKDWPDADIQGLPREVRAKLDIEGARLHRRAHGPSRSERLVHAAQYLLIKKYPIERIAAILLEHRGVGAHARDQPDPENAVERAISFAEGKIGGQR
jgi:hypothetical protein